MAHPKPLLRHAPRWRSGLVAVPLADGRARAKHVYVPLGGMVDVAVHELGATLTHVERLEPASRDGPSH